MLQAQKGCFVYERGAGDLPSTRVEPNPNPEVLEVLPKRPADDEVDPNVLLPNILPETKVR